MEIPIVNRLDDKRIYHTEFYLTLNNNEKIEKIEMLAGFKRSRIFGLRLIYPPSRKATALVVELYLIFREAKFTYHKPGRVYRNQDPEEVKKWRKETKPIVKAAFKDKETVILTEDEMILSTQTTFQKIWAARRRVFKSGDIKH